MDRYEALIRAARSHADTADALESSLERIAELEHEGRVAHARIAEVLEEVRRARAALKSYVIVEMLNSAFRRLEQLEMKWFGATDGRF
ncbi:MAG: hypothetical protein ACYC46_16115 [Acidobacteriaceae bacterium]